MNSEQGQEGAELRDDQIVAMALADRRYFRLLYQRYADRLYRYAAARADSVSIADDVVSDTMLAALENLERWDPDRGSFATWLFVIARRKLIDQQRAILRFRGLVKRLRHVANSPPEPDGLERLLIDERMQEIQDAIRRLPSRDQEVIALRYGAGLRGADIATILGVSHGAARQRLRRAHQRLAQQIEKGSND